MSGLLCLLMILVTMTNLMVAGYVTDIVCMSTLHLLRSIDAFCMWILVSLSTNE